MTEKQKAYKMVLDDLMQCDLFCGKYDAINGNKKYMYGINTVMEFIALRISEEECDRLSNMFLDNMAESEKNKGL